MHACAYTLTPADDVEDFKQECEQSPPNLKPRLLDIYCVVRERHGKAKYIYGL